MLTENGTYTLLLLGWLRSSYEKDPESGLYYAGARYYNPKIGSFNSTDELWHLSPDKTSYHYCSNNPENRVDPNGMADVELDTKYINKKGELLFETEDGLSDIIIVPDNNLSKFEKELRSASDNGKINDKKNNKEKMHTLGVNIETYKLNVGSSSFDVGYSVGYEYGYSEKKSIFTDIWFKYFVNLLIDVPDGGQISGGYRVGKKEGSYDKDNGYINKKNPYESIKRNKPLLKIK